VGRTEGVLETANKLVTKDMQAADDMHLYNTELSAWSTRATQFNREYAAPSPITHRNMVCSPLVMCRSAHQRKSVDG
jgi:hypothetical protein